MQSPSSCNLLNVSKQNPWVQQHPSRCVSEWSGNRLNTDRALSRCLRQRLVRQSHHRDGRFSQSPHLVLCTMCAHSGGCNTANSPPDTGDGEYTPCPAHAHTLTAVRTSAPNACPCHLRQIGGMVRGQLFLNKTALPLFTFKRQKSDSFFQNLWRSERG